MAEHQHRAAASGACLLPFPQKFDAARSFVDGLTYGSDLLSDDAWLALGALHSQATKGPCQEPKKWGSLLPSSSSAGSSSQAEAAWRELGTMPSAEAMRLYVRVLDEEAPGWWRAVGAVGSSGAVGREGEEEGQGGGKEKNGGENDDEEEDEDVGRWVSLSTTPDSASSSSSSSGTPCPRYEHAAALLGRALFVVGGSRAGGRMLSDTWCLDLETLRWTDLFRPASSSSVSPSATGGSLPPRAGLCLLPWRKGLLAIGGHAPKSGRGGPAPTEMEVWRLEPGTGGGTGGGGGGGPRWTLVPTGVAEGSRPPPPRGGHSVTVIPGTSRAFVFGGEVDGDGRGPSSDLFELRLDSMTWRGPLRVRGGGSDSSNGGRKNASADANPAPRSGHVTAAVGRFLVVFGGADGDGVFGDVAVLDVDALQWLRPEVQVREEDDDDEEEENDGDDGDKRRRRQRRQKNKNFVVSPRAGASAAVIGKTVFVAGGGDGSDNSSSSSSSFEAATLALDCSRLPLGPLVWRRAATDDDDQETSAPASPASSEGLALVALPQVRALLAFGGNAGRLHANLAVLRPKAGVIVDDDEEDEDDEEEEDDDDDDGEAERAAAIGGGAGAAGGAAAGAAGTAAASAAAAAASSSSSPSPSELALMRRQLASAQAAAADAAARADEAEREAERLRAENGRLRRRLAAVLNGDDSEEEEEEGGDGGEETGAAAAVKGGSGEGSSRRPRVWAYISGDA